MNITKSLANTIAGKIVSNSEANKRREAKVKEVSLEVYSAVVAEIPAEVIEFYKKFPEFVYTSSHARIQKKGWWENIVFDKPVPHRFGESFRPTLPDAQQDDILKRLAEANAESNRLDKVRYDLEELIYRQKTVKRLLEAMPEAANYLPETEKETGAVPAIIKPQDLLNKLV